MPQHFTYFPYIILLTMNCITADIINENSCLLYSWPKYYSLEMIVQFFYRFRIPFVSKFNGFMVTIQQAIDLESVIYNQFGLHYDIPHPSIYQQLFCCFQDTKQHQISSQFLTSWQLIGMEKCSFKPMRFILGHQWGQGKTVISLSIAKDYNQSDYLVIVAPKVLHYFWKSHLSKFYRKNVLLCAIQELLVNEKHNQFTFLHQQCHKIVIITQEEMPILGSLSQEIKNFIIIDEIHTLSPEYTIYTKSFTHGLGLTSCPEASRFPLIQFLCHKIPQQFIRERYGKQQHQYEKSCILRSYFMHDADNHQHFNIKRIYVEISQKITKNQKISQMLDSITFQDQSSVHFFDLRTFQSIIFDLKERYIQQYIQLCLSNRHIDRILYYYSQEIVEIFQSLSKFNPNKNCKIVCLRKTRRQDLELNKETVHTFLQFYFDQAMVENNWFNLKCEFLILENSPEEKLFSKIMKCENTQMKRKSILKKTDNMKK